jgi:hypothetical protein
MDQQQAMLKSTSTSMYADTFLDQMFGTLSQAPPAPSLKSVVTMPVPRPKDIGLLPMPSSRSVITLPSPPSYESLFPSTVVVTTVEKHEQVDDKSLSLVDDKKLTSVDDKLLSKVDGKKRSRSPQPHRETSKKIPKYESTKKKEEAPTQRIPTKPIVTLKSKKVPSFIPLNKVHENFLNGLKHKTMEDYESLMVSNLSMLKYSFQDFLDCYEQDKKLRHVIPLVEQAIDFFRDQKKTVHDIFDFHMDRAITDEFRDKLHILVGIVSHVVKYIWQRVKVVCEEPFASQYQYSWFGFYGMFKAVTKRIIHTGNDTRWSPPKLYHDVPAILASYDRSHRHYGH